MLVDDEEISGVSREGLKALVDGLVSEELKLGAASDGATVGGYSLSPLTPAGPGSSWATSTARGKGSAPRLIDRGDPRDESGGIASPSAEIVNKWSGPLKDMQRSLRSLSAETSASHKLGKSAKSPAE
jgi:hypothetical protein